MSIKDREYSQSPPKRWTYFWLRRHRSNASAQQEKVTYGKEVIQVTHQCNEKKLPLVKKWFTSHISATRTIYFDCWGGILVTYERNKTIYPPLVSNTTCTSSREEYPTSGWEEMQVTHRRNEKNNQPLVENQVTHQRKGIHTIPLVRKKERTFNSATRRK